MTVQPEVSLADNLCEVFLPRPEHLAHFGFNPSNIIKWRMAIVIGGTMQSIMLAAWEVASGMYPDSVKPPLAPPPSP